MKFKTKTGLLTDYALSCGYIETKNGVRLEKEHNVYHVKSHVDGFKWMSYDKLTEARKMYKLLVNTKWSLKNDIN